MSWILRLASLILLAVEGSSMESSCSNGACVDDRTILMQTKRTLATGAERDQKTKHIQNRSATGDACWWCPPECYGCSNYAGAFGVTSSDAFECLFKSEVPVSLVKSALSRHGYSFSSRMRNENDLYNFLKVYWRDYDKENGCKPEEPLIYSTNDAIKEAEQKQAKYWTNKADKIKWDGVNSIPVHVQHIVNDYVSEIFFRIPVEANGITVREVGDEIQFDIPKNERVQASYYRRSPAGNIEEDWGISNMRWGQQSGMPMFSPDITVGLAEKLHAFGSSTHRTLETTADRRAQQHSSSFILSDDQTKHAKWMTQASLLAQPGAQIMKVSGIPNKEVKDWANNGNEFWKLTTTGGNMVECADDMKKKLNEKFNVMLCGSTQCSPSQADLNRFASSAKPQFSQLICMHFDNVPTAATPQLIGWDSVPADKIRFKTEKKYATYRGATSSSPFVSFDVTQGASYWRYDAATASIELYYAAAIKGHLPDPEGNVGDPGMVWVSPGFAPVYIDHGNKNDFGAAQGAAAYALKQRAKVYNDDFDFLARDPASMCTARQLQKIKELIPDFVKHKDTIAEMEMMNADGEAGEAGMGSQLDYLYVLTDLVTALLPCSTSFLRPDDSHRGKFDFYLANALAHAAMEIPPADLIAMITTTDWNTWTADRISNLQM